MESKATCQICEETDIEARHCEHCGAVICDLCAVIEGGECFCSERCAEDSEAEIEAERQDREETAMWLEMNR